MLQSGGQGEAGDERNQDGATSIMNLRSRAGGCSGCVRPCRKWAGRHRKPKASLIRDGKTW